MGGIRLRAFGSLEHIFWLIDQNRPTHFVVAAETIGKTAAQDVVRAVGRASGIYVRSAGGGHFVIHSVAD